MNRILLLSLLAAVALAVVAAGSASATVLCKFGAEPCASNYPNGTAIEAALTGS